MESSGIDNSCLRSAVEGGEPPMKIQSSGRGYKEDDSWTAAVVSGVRIVVCFVTLMVTTFVWTVIMVLLVPWPTARIKQGNLYGHVTGRSLPFCDLGYELWIQMWILGNPIKIEGIEFSNKRAIFICNHASPLDVFLTMRLIPQGTVYIAKKEIIWYPLIGQLYVLASHLRIDRSNPTSAIESMKEAARMIVKNNLSLVMFPEGTRSKTGRLLPFKKGFVHMALQSRLPIVPIVITGTHQAWRKGSLHIRPTPLTVKYLPPIKTDEWTVEKIHEYVEMIHALYANHLPENQRPLASERMGQAKSLKS